MYIFSAWNSWKICFLQQLCDSTRCIWQTTLRKRWGSFSGFQVLCWKNWEEKRHLASYENPEPYRAYKIQLPTISKTPIERNFCRWTVGNGSIVVSNVPLINRWWVIYNHVAIYTTYIPLIYCQLGDYISPNTYQGNQKQPLIGGLGCVPMVCWKSLRSDLFSLRWLKGFWSHLQWGAINR